jgi:hypothetical protein
MARRAEVIGADYTISYSTARPARGVEVKSGTTVTCRASRSWGHWPGVVVADVEGMAILEIVTAHGGG